MKVAWRSYQTQPPPLWQTEFDSNEGTASSPDNIYQQGCNATYKISNSACQAKAGQTNVPNALTPSGSGRPWFKPVSTNVITNKHTWLHKYNNSGSQWQKTLPFSLENMLTNWPNASRMSVSSRSWNKLVVTKVALNRNIWIHGHSHPFRGCQWYKVCLPGRRHAKQNP